jgi:hypothetical protein
MCCVDADTSRAQDKKKAVTSTSTSLKSSSRMSIDDDFMDNDDVVPTASTSFSTTSSSSFRKDVRSDSRKRDDGDLHRYQNRNLNDKKTFSLSIVKMNIKIKIEKMTQGKK